jgi:hypothetical protein
MTLCLDANGLGPIGSSQHTADTDDDQVARKMLAIGSAARVFESLGIVENRNDILVSNGLRDRTLHIQQESDL